MKINVRTRPKVLCAEAAGSGICAELKALYGHSWDVVTTNDGHEALDLLKKQGHLYRLVIIHTLLPVVSGEVLCRMIRKEDRLEKLPVILIGESAEDLTVHSERLGIQFLERASLRARIPHVVNRCLATSGDQWLNFRPKASRALVVDDSPKVRQVLRRYLENMDIEVAEADSGQAMERFLGRETVDFIMLDVMMPNEDGLQLLKRLKSTPRYKNTPVIMVSGLDESDTIADALEMGAMDYITKPICLRRFRARVNSCLDGIKLRKMEEKRRQELSEVNCELREKVQLYTRGLKESHRGMIFALSKLAESRDPETGEHLERLQEYCRVLGEAMLEQDLYQETLSREFIDNLVAASPLHDIGKVGIPDAVLLKPGRLTPEEFETMKRHSEIGAATLAASAKHFGNNPLLEMGIEITQFHHEKWDGSGYPTGLKGESIPLSARILALGDVYDALTSKRVYKEAFSHDVARNIILEGRGSHFDPVVVDSFLSVEERFQFIRETYNDTAKEILSI